MKFATLEVERRQVPAVCTTGDRWVDLRVVLNDLGHQFSSESTMLSLIPLVEKDLERLHETVKTDSTQCLRPGSYTFLAPLPRPAKNIFCVGRNYLDHVEEGSRYRGVAMELPAFPVYFSKPPTTVIGPDATIDLHAAITSQLDYEAELAVIIGKSGRNIAPENVLDHVFGYCILNDVSARDLQKDHVQWFKGKALDGSAPMGPWILHRNFVPDVQALNIRLTVNGEQRQSANTGQMIFDVRKLVSDLSRGITLDAGDIIATGTPAGVGMAMLPPHALAAGDVIEISIDGLGVLRNTVR